VILILSTKIPVLTCDLDCNVCDKVKHMGVSFPAAKVIVEEAGRRAGGNTAHEHSSIPFGRTENKGKGDWLACRRTVMAPSLTSGQ